MTRFASATFWMPHAKPPSSRESPGGIWQATRSQIQSIVTPEQQQKLEQLKQQRRQQQREKQPENRSGRESARAIPV